MELQRAFEEHFRRPPQVAARAPGRVNLIGEHTDYNQGWVLPVAIDRATWVMAARRDDGQVRALACDLAKEATFEVAKPVTRGGWIDYVQGVVSALGERGAGISGLDLAIASEVPRESGLSSSAALQVALATLFDAAFELGLPRRARAQVAHRAESHFVGVACGIMDQFASAFGRRDHAVRIDCRSLELELVPLPGEGLALLLADSGVRRSLLAGAYGDRRAECEAALREARQAGVAAPGARALRDLEPEALPALERALAPRLMRRARHVITENERVHRVCRALREGELARVGAELRAGMRSLREDFEVSTPELDALCERADAHPAVYGSRLTGAGFGGCTLHLVRPEALEEVADWIARGFVASFGRRPPLHRVRAAQGAQVLAL